MGSGFLVDLFRGNVRLYNNTLRIQLNIRATTRFETAIAIGGWVVRICIRKSILLPSQSGHSVLNRIENYLGVLDAREVEVFGEIVDQLFHSNVVARSAP